MTIIRIPIVTKATAKLSSIMIIPSPTRNRNKRHVANKFSLFVMEQKFNPLIRFRSIFKRLELAVEDKVSNPVTLSS